MEYLKHEEREKDLGLMPAAIAVFYLGWEEYTKGDLEEAKNWWSKVDELCTEIVEKFPEPAYYREALRFKALLRYFEALKALEVGEKAKAWDLLAKALELLRRDVKAMSEVIAAPPMPAEVPGAYYERALAHYYTALLLLGNIFYGS